MKIKAMIEGEPYRGSIVRTGTTCHILGVRKKIRQKIGKTIRDEIEVTIEEDTDVREGSIPPDLILALQNAPDTEAVFRQLAYTHQNEYVQWIEEARRGEIRRNRIEKTVQMLLDRKKGHE